MRRLYASTISIVAQPASRPLEPVEQAFLPAVPATKELVEARIVVAPELRGRRNRAAFERGLELLHAGLEARRSA